MATLLQVIAGPDGNDPPPDRHQDPALRERSRQGRRRHEDRRHHRRLRPSRERGCGGTARSGPRCSASPELGATVDEVLDPHAPRRAAHLERHRGRGRHRADAEGQTASGTNWEGYYATSLIDAYARGWRSRPDDLSETVKTVMMLGRVHAPQLPRPLLRQGAEPEPQAALGPMTPCWQSNDVLAMPDAADAGGPSCRRPDCSREHYVDVALNMLGQHLPVRRHGPPGHDGAVRQGGPTPPSG